LKEHSHEYLRKPKPSVLQSELQDRLDVLKQRVSRNLLDDVKAETQRDSPLSQKSKQFKTEEDIAQMQRALSQYHIQARKDYSEKRREAALAEQKR